jgi:hypothetical protein
VERDVAVRNFLRVTGREDHIFASLALVGTDWTSIFERRVPDIVDVGIERAAVSPGHLDHDRSDVPRVEEAIN